MTSPQEPSAQQIAPVRAHQESVCAYARLGCSLPGQASPTLVHLGARFSHATSLYMSTPYPAVDPSSPPLHGGGSRERALLLTVRHINIAGEAYRCHCNFIFGCYVTAGRSTNPSYPSNSKRRSGKSLSFLGLGRHNGPAILVALTPFTPNQSDLPPIAR